MANTPSNPQQREELPFSVEIWGSNDGAAVERVLALAFSATLARAILKAAIEENPGRRITLRRGENILEDIRPLTTP